VHKGSPFTPVYSEFSLRGLSCMFDHLDESPTSEGARLFEECPFSSRSNRMLEIPTPRWCSTRTTAPQNARVSVPCKKLRMSPFPHAPSTPAGLPGPNPFRRQHGPPLGEQRRLDHTENMVLLLPPSILDTGNFRSLPLLPVRIHSCVAARSYRALFPRTKAP